MAEVRTYTFRDAGLHSRLLRGVNVAGAALAAVGFERPVLTPAAVRDAAIADAGLDDFGPDTLDEPLEVLCEAFEREAKLTTFGRMACKGLLVSALANRLKLIDWAKRHPEVREERVSPPWIILGLPRTGTTLLSRLLALDPNARPLLHWEAASPVPPPELATHAEDPRIARAQKTTLQLGKLNPPFKAMHPMGATLSTECVTLFIFDLRSLSIETQALVPSYGRWLEQADVRPTYEMHKLGLQVMQSRMPTEAWSLKTPQHLWHLDTLRAVYPDARLIWTHRDPRKVVTSVASLNTSMHKVMSDRVDPLAVGKDWNHKLSLAIRRGMEHDDAAAGERWCHHLHYAELMSDPLSTVEALYTHFGQELLPLHRRRIETWMQQRSQSAFGRHGYDPADFGFDDAMFEADYGDYVTRYGIKREG